MIKCDIFISALNKEHQIVKGRAFSDFTHDNVCKYFKNQHLFDSLNVMLMITLVELIPRLGGGLKFNPGLWPPSSADVQTMAVTEKK